MRNILILLLLCVVSLGSSAQELNCNVVVNAQLTGNENLQLYKTLENQLTEFVNKRKWTKKTVGIQERIDCNIVINVTENYGENFKAGIQVQQ